MQIESYVVQEEVDKRETIFMWFIILFEHRGAAGPYAVRKWIYNSRSE